MDAVATLLCLNENTKHNGEFIRNGLDHQIKKCLLDVIKASMTILTRKRGYFDLFGCDFMITTDNEVKLLEINSNPALSLDNSTLANILPNIVDDTISLVLAAQGPDLPNSSLKDPTREDNKSEILNNLPGKFSLIYNENTKYEYS